MNNEKKEIKFTVLLPEKTYERLRKEAYISHVSSSWIIRQALNDLFVEKDLDKFFNKHSNDENK